MRSAQRRPGVVGGLPRPHEVPQGDAQGLGGGVELGQQVGEEAGPLGQACAQKLVLAAIRRRGAGAGAEALEDGGPIEGASSRKYSATRPERAPAGPAPTHTSSPLAQRLSSHDWE